MNWFLLLFFGLVFMGAGVAADSAWEHRGPISCCMIVRIKGGVYSQLEQANHVNGVIATSLAGSMKAASDCSASVASLQSAAQGWQSRSKAAEAAAQSQGTRAETLARRIAQQPNPADQSCAAKLAASEAILREPSQ